MAKGFNVKTVNYILEISGVAKIPFIVEFDKNLKTTDIRAINTAGLIWGLFMNGTSELYDAVADKLDSNSANAILDLHQQHKDEKHIGHLKAFTDNGKSIRLVEYASHLDMRRNLKTYEALDFAAQL